ncbi:SulP family inorganic anion transporter [Rhodobacteraceae bacterium RKSG542]|uniref:SulP family inorganic anion transporter n=1 Tax=Pseudovibrio flavus TaxID=2529854 RepID=UPI0012BD421C|nr:SulP family inorganic anion transporter [Pseudovibrio flavus]MTI16231.1 SulP family inorganic anion transporter [Pseudovibrio flavus]
MLRPKLLTTMETYNLHTFLADLFAGATVAMVALPLSLAIAIASGANPADGLVTAIVAGFLISLLGGSRVQIGGPTGAFIVVVFGVIQQHGYDGLVLATFMAGILLVIAGFLRLGRFVSFVPEPVVNGFTIGIAIIIATGQIKDFLGLNLAHDPAEFIGKLAALWNGASTFNIAACAIGLGTIAAVIFMRRSFPRLPALIIAVTVTSILAYVVGMPVDTIASRFGELPSTLPMPHIPTFSVQKIIELMPSAFTIAFLAGIESLLSAMVADRMIGSKHRSNAEVLAMGVANIGSAIFCGLPATGAIARTATNVRAGGKTPVAGIVHALVILIIMMVAAPLAGYMAMPAMAALLMLTAWGMSEPANWPKYWQAPIEERGLLLITLVLTVLTDLTIGIGVGIALGVLLQRFRPQADVL